MWEGLGEFGPAVDAPEAGFQNGFWISPKSKGKAVTYLIKE